MSFPKNPRPAAVFTEKYYRLRRQRQREKLASCLYCTAYAVLMLTLLLVL